MLTIAIALLAAVQSPASAPSTANAEVASEDPVVCRGRRDLSFGSHMSQGRVCKRKSEWDEIARNARRELQQMNQRGSNPAPIPGARP